MGIHWTELVIVAFMALLIFGPKRLPEIGGAVGRTYREFKKSLADVSELAARELDPERQLSAVPAGRDGERADAAKHDAPAARS